MTRTSRPRGGFAIGLVLGVLVGLVMALAVALYVTKVPVPFVNKVPQRTAEQDAADAERNRNWNPNSGLGPRGAASAPATVAAPAAPATTAPPPATPATTPPVSAAPGGTPRDPAAILGDRTLPPATSAAAASDPFTYFVQAGAYTRPEDAEQQRARLGMLGVEARLSEREQAGRTMYRVRAGPFDRKEDAEATKDKLSGQGVDAALVRVQKP